MQQISQSLTGNHALSWLLKMPSIKKKMPSLSTNQPSVILPFIDKFDKYSSWLKEGEGGSFLDKTSSLYPDSLIEVLRLNLVGTGYPRLYLHLDTNI